MTVPTRRFLDENHQLTVHLWGPNSGGGEDLVIAGGRIFRVSYGDAARHPDVDGYEISELPRAAFELGYAGDPRMQEALALVRAQAARSSE